MVIPFLPPHVLIVPASLPPMPPVTTAQAETDETGDPSGAIAVPPISSPESIQPEFSGTRRNHPAQVSSDQRMAQAVVPSSDGTGTVVTPSGNRIDITEGQRSGDGTNLFHSFQEFGLSADQIANFIATPEIQNILGTVNGGNASIINGLLQVSGSNANLYLINPAGIIFGPDATLNLNGAFTATTANQIGFGDTWLDVLNPAGHQALTGTPNQFAFTSEQPGVILNLGNLTVDTGQDLTLIGGEVISLGNLTAPEGTITLLAVPGENRVRLSQDNMLLSLEITPSVNPNSQQLFDPLSLPELLTGGSALADNNLTLVQDPDGTIRLASTSAAAPIELGSVIASGDLSTAGDRGGQIYLLGQQVSLLNATANASGAFGGGSLRIGGDAQGGNSLPRANTTQIDTASVVSADATTRSGNGGSIVVWADTTATVDGSLTARGGNLSGNGGLIETSAGVQLNLSRTPDASASNGVGGTWLIDPTDITIVSGGGGPINSTVIEAANINSALNSGTNVSIITNSSGTEAGNITQQAGATIEKASGPAATLSLTAINDIILNDNIEFAAGGSLTVNLTADSDSNGSGLVDANSGTRLETGGGNVSISGADVQIGHIDTTFNSVAGGQVTINSNSNVAFESIDASSNASVAPAGSVTVIANGTVSGTGSVASAPNTTIRAVDNIGGGTVTIQHDGGQNNVPFEVGITSSNGTAGAIATDSVLNSGSFPVLATDGSVNPTPNITITSVNTPPTLSVTEPLPSTEVNQPVSFILGNLNPAITDINSDNTTFIVDSINGTLLQNGVAIAPGDEVAATDQLQYTPSAGISGEVTAFTLQANDGVSSSASVPISINIAPSDSSGNSNGNGSGNGNSGNGNGNGNDGNGNSGNGNGSNGNGGNDPDPGIEIPDVSALTLETVPSLNLALPINQKQVVLRGLAVAQSPPLEELSILGVVLPEPGWLIVEATVVTTGNGSSGNSGGNAANFPSFGFMTSTDGIPSQPGDPGGTADFGQLQEPDDPPPDDSPVDSEVDSEVDPQTEPQPEDPSADSSTSASVEDTAAGTSDGESSSSASVEVAEDPASEAESSTGEPEADSVAIRPEEATAEPAPESTTSSTVNQQLKNCQAEAEKVQATAARDRTSTVYQRLIDCYQGNLATATAQNNSQWIAYSLNNLAISYFVLGDYLTALDLHQQQLEKATAINDPTQKGIALGGIGAAYAALGDYATAIDFYRRSLEVMPIETAPQWKALTYRNLGNAYFAEKNYTQAADYQQTSLDISRGAGDTYGEMQAYGNLGATLAIQGNFADAIAAYENGLALATTLNNELETAQILLGLSTAYAYQQNYEQAYRYSQESLTIIRQLGASLGEGIALTNLGNALLYLERLPEAEQALFRAVAIWESLRAGLGTNNDFKVSIFETQLAAYRNLQEVLVTQGKITPALEISERGRARAFVELLAREQFDSKQAGELSPPTVAQMQQIARSQNATLVEYAIIRDQTAEAPHAISVQNPIEPRDAQLYIWVVQPSGTVQFRQVNLYDSLSASSVQSVVTEARLALTGRSLDTAVAANRGIGIVTDAARNAPIRSGDFVRRQGDLPDIAPYQVVSVSADGKTVTVTHPEFALPNPVLPVDQIYRVDEETPKTNPLQQLHTLLIDPIADLLPSDPTAPVIFVPQEHLFLVPFAALQNAQGQYLIEQHTPVITPSIQTLELLNQTTARSTAIATEALIVGNPSPMPGNYAPLPSAEAEAASIADLLSTSPLLGDVATESQIKEQLSSANLIHLATHGQFDESQPLQGAVALAPDARNDGFLTAAEILDLPLQADLVILSACDTGRGRITGDGVIGLSRSFMAAGVPRVVVSLWQVPDAPTAELMIAFHQQRLQGLDTAQALRQAMLSTREVYPDPAVWAAFTQIGNSPTPY